MPHINSTEFGEITIDGKKYGQVLIIGDSIMERDYEKLEKLFGTTHRVGDWERDELIKGNPEIIVIGTGQSSVMNVDGEITDSLAKKGIEIIVVSTPEAVEIYNAKVKEGKRVNALIHTTC
ncbi:MAG: hypothetical protein COU82_00605 [Candidatus Portnoybacteria bacterium CG10_big_fil_rev_8_21_14_0_10_38_18]|uniref:Uncharacterized protein n=1 Tax=Candidatus Portnoybacteria bacterium CG10_big_fil_rev_8_21_14_0_10_38_18 TaxID=1974813 RepID=A0A2M8KCP2_9BACT|nr:MAG: hypothetical protein COU82_00605 [Candidatus Portnoybacteria bacterium CG10_big_fil_rev_8_21_14_0_10_38_18]